MNDPAVLQKVPRLARELGVPRRTLLRQLLALDARDAKEGRARWLAVVTGPSGRRTLKVNRQALEAEHPEMFKRAGPLEERIARLERRLHEESKYSKSLGARLRKLEQKAHASGANGATSGH